MSPEDNRLTEVATTSTRSGVLGSRNVFDANAGFIHLYQFLSNQRCCGLGKVSGAGKTFMLVRYPVQLDSLGFRLGR